MERTHVQVALRLVAAALVLAGLSAAVCFVPANVVGTSGAAYAATSTPDTSTADTSTPDTSTPDTSTPDTSTADTSTAKPKKDTRPKAPKFVPHKGKAIYLDRKHQRVYFYVDGRQIRKTKCSTSRTLPRRGTYHMKRKRKQSWSFNGAVTFYWQVIFTKGPHGHNIAFHSIPVNSSGHEIAPVGQPVSHGCVRLPYKTAKWLYKWINKKTPIVVRP
jgi:lipoprotein-anchoring transpeptidase ErfK/SrfK